jgi:succinate dehydrogenase/fumarate reductase flavoprotein subunit
MSMPFAELVVRVLARLPRDPAGRGRSAGVRVNDDARVLDTAGRPLPGLYAAGELVGGLFFHDYPGGSGLTAGAVYGRRAGRAAAAAAEALSATR